MPKIHTSSSGMLKGNIISRACNIFTTLTPSQATLLGADSFNISQLNSVSLGQCPKPSLLVTGRLIVGPLNST
jgi:hypothetical protein